MKFTFSNKTKEELEKEMNEKTESWFKNDLYTLSKGLQRNDINLVKSFFEEDLKITKINIRIDSCKYFNDCTIMITRTYFGKIKHSVMVTIPVEKTNKEILSYLFEKSLNK